MSCTVIAHDGRPIDLGPDRQVGEKEKQWAMAVSGRPAGALLPPVCRARGWPQPSQHTQLPPRLYGLWKRGTSSTPNELVACKALAPAREAWGGTQAHHNDVQVGAWALKCHAPSTLQLSVTALHSFWATRPFSLLTSELSSALEILVLSCSARHTDAQSGFPCRGGSPTNFQRPQLTAYAHPPDPTDRDRATGGMEIDGDRLYF